MATLIEEADQGSRDLLSTLSDSSFKYLKSIIGQQNLPLRDETLVKRHIVHISPHLDEYFAELFFRAVSRTDNNIEFIEEGLYSENDDSNVRELWPEAVVFGFGKSVKYETKPVLMFDEHSPEGKKASSCSEMAVEYFKTMTDNKIPASVQTVLNEINYIDRFGKSHPQHLGNIIKSFHNVRFLLSKGLTSNDDIREYPSATWKRAIIDACITGVIYALENRIDIFDGAIEKKLTVQKSLKYYVEYTPHKLHPLFKEAYQDISTYIGNQRQVFWDAVLKDARGRILVNSKGRTVGQSLILSRINFACNTAWGEKITNVIMMHLWEIEFQNQINYLSIKHELESIPPSYGSFEKRIPTVGVIRRKVLNIRGDTSIWILNIVQAANTFNANKPALNYINEYNHGYGILLLEDPVLPSKALFRAISFPKEKWMNLIEEINAIEPEIWHDESTDPKNPAPFINNGSKTHQYTQLSVLDLFSLCELVKKVYKRL